ncbi:MAG: 30S ribosomal protein S4 [Candidatus Woesearchaeota archaeon]
MGDPKKLRKQYQTPAHPWIKKTIDDEKILVKEYGLKKKQEIQIANSFLKKYKNIAKKLIADSTEQGAKEKVQMMNKLKNIGLVSSEAKLDDVLSLEIKDILGRRIQSLLHKKGLARTMNQARQFIVHGHVSIGKKTVTSPSTILTLEEESNLNFSELSQLKDEEHPERVSVVKEIAKEKEAIKKGNTDSEKSEDAEPVNVVEISEDEE